MTRRVARIVAVLTVSLATVATAQSYRTLVESRRYSGESILRVDVEFAAGEFLLGPAANGVLYRLALVYDENRFEPDMHFGADRGRLDVGLSSIRDRDLLDTDNLHQRLDLSLSRDVPLDLDIAFGAAEGDIELGGLMLTEAVVKTGASETEIRFSEPNRATCDRLRFEVGAAEFDALRLGNARCRSIELSGAVGEMVLDFTGEWSSDVPTRVRIKIGLGEVRLRLPESLGVRLDVDRFLVGLDQSGFRKRGGRYFSHNYDDAETKISIEIDAALGNIEIDWIPR